MGIRWTVDNLRNPTRWQTCEFCPRDSVSLANPQGLELLRTMALFEYGCWLHFHTRGGWKGLYVEELRSPGSLYWNTVASEDTLELLLRRMKSHLRAVYGWKGEVP